MLGHNETQLDSYNKNAPKAHGIYLIIYERSSPIGISREFTEIIRDLEEQSLKLIFPKNTKNYY